MDKYTGYQKVVIQYYERWSFAEYIAKANRGAKRGLILLKGRRRTLN